MTEDQAKQKWCPMYRFIPTNGSNGDNRVRSIQNTKANCIASDCMAWRTSIDPVDAAIAEVDPDGYCGLAGK